MAVVNRHEPFRNFVYTRKVDNQPEHIVSISGKPFFDEVGDFLGYRGTARDVTEQVLAERQLRAAKTTAEAANRAKSQFLANVSHELRTPLNAVIGFSELLELGVAEPLQPQQIEYIRSIHQSGKHLLNVINDILDLAKVDAGKLELHEEAAIDPRSLVDACVVLIAERAKEADLTLSVEIDEEMSLLVADTTRLKQILLNLLSNSVKFTEPGGSIIVSMRRTEEGGVKFEVRDTGPGMSEEEIKVALEPFGQIDARLERRHQGTGLGLPLARRLAELHGGSLRIDSQKRFGTTVIVKLPPERVVRDLGGALVKDKLATA